MQERKFTPEQIAQLERLCRPRLKLQDSSHIELILPLIWREWVDFVWHCKKRPALLFQYMALGEEAAKLFDPQYLPKKISLLKEWHAIEIKNFEAKIAFFVHCQIIVRGARKKHWPSRKMDLEEIRALSKRKGESIFVSEINARDLYSCLLLLFATFPDRLKKGQRYYTVDMETLIGYSQGFECRYIRFDISCGTLQAHGYPVTTKETKRYPIVSLSDGGLVFVPQRIWKVLE